MTEILKLLGMRIKILREALNLSQEQLAEQCGFDRTYISMIERGKRNMSFSNLAKIAAGLDVSVSQLTEGIEYGSYPD